MIYSQNVHDYIIWHLLSTHNYLMTYIFHNHATCHQLISVRLLNFLILFLLALLHPSTINIDGWESCKYRKMIAYSVIYAHTIGPGSKPGGYGILYTKFLTTTITP